MSSSDNDLNIPNLGPAQREPDLAAGPKAAPKPAAQPVAPEIEATAQQPVTVVTERRRGVGVLTGGVLMMVVAACVGLGYWVMELQLQFQTRTAELTEARYQIGELRELLQTAESSALESGQSLIGQVGQMSSTAQSKYTHYDSEIAKLWTIAYQRNKPELEAQKKTLQAQSEQLTSQSKLLDEQGKQLATQNKQLGELLTLVEAQKVLLAKQDEALKTQQKQFAETDKQIAGLVTQSANVDKAVNYVNELKSSQDQLSTAQTSQSKATGDALASVKRELAGTRTELSTQAEILNEQLAEQADALKVLEARLNNAPKTSSGDTGLKRRVAINEDAIRAFDGTRRQLNRELLQIRQKLNNLQLKVESR